VIAGDSRGDNLPESEEKERAVTGNKPFRLGAWTIHPEDGTLRSATEVRRVEPQAMQLLVLLASRPGGVFSKQEILDTIWEGRFVGEDSLTGAVSQLRKALGDERGRPRYIETLPKRGYRLVAAREDDWSARASPAANRRLAVAGGLLLLLAAGGGAAVWRWSTRAPEPVGSLAVLPLQDLSAGGEDGSLAEGLTAALISELAKRAPLRVISHTSVRGYRGTGRSVPEIAAELRVDAVVEGALARHGGRVRVDVQLIDARTDSHLWAESYDRELKDVLRLQAEIAQSVSRGIRVRLAAAGGDPGARPPSRAPEAVEAYLKGRALLDHRSPEALGQAAAYFEQAVRREPEFAAAFAGLAEASVYRLELEDDADTATRARTAAQRALALDPELAEAHVAHAMILAWLDWDLAGSEAELRWALERQPSLSQARRWHALVLITQGRPEEAVGQAREAVLLDPLHLPAYWDLAEVLILARRYDEVLAQMDAALVVDPRSANAHFHRAAAYWFLGKEPQAWAAFRLGLERQGLTDPVLRHLDELFAREGMRGVFAAAARHLEAQPVQSPSTRRHIALYSAAAGERDRAFALLEEGYRRRQPQWQWLPHSPWADPLRTDPRFAEWVRRLHGPAPASSASPSRP